MLKLLSKIRLEKDLEYAQKEEFKTYRQSIDFTRKRLTMESLLNLSYQNFTGAMLKDYHFMCYNQKHAMLLTNRLKLRKENLEGYKRRPSFPSRLHNNRIITLVDIEFKPLFR